MVLLCFRSALVEKLKNEFLDKLPDVYNNQKLGEKVPEKMFISN